MVLWWWCSTGPPLRAACGAAGLHRQPHAQEVRRKRRHADPNENCVRLDCCCFLMLCRGLLLPDATIIEVSATATMARITMTNQSLTTKHGPPCGGRGLPALAAGCGQGRAEPGAAAGVPVLLPHPAH